MAIFCSLAGGNKRPKNVSPKQHKNANNSSSYQQPPLMRASLSSQSVGLIGALSRSSVREIRVGTSLSAVGLANINMTGHMNNNVFWGSSVEAFSWNCLAIDSILLLKCVLCKPFLFIITLKFLLLASTCIF